MRVAVLGNSIMDNANGASMVNVPDLLERMARAGGVPDWTFDNFCTPGQTWGSAHKHGPTWDDRQVSLIGGKYTPVEAMNMRPRYDRIMVCDGYNDRANPDALRDFQEFYSSIAGFDDGGPEVVFVRQNCLLDNGKVSAKGKATQAEADAMEAIYSTIPNKFYGASLAKLYEMGFTYDGTHLTNTGKQLYAASVYRGMQDDFELTPITWNTAEVYKLFLAEDKTLFYQMVRINT